MSAPVPPAAIMVFGSAARHDSDAMSDRDVLVVGNSRRTDGEDLGLWKRSGWMPAWYSWGKLFLAIARGSLFIQHLKQEGQIVKDSGDLLRTALGDFCPNPSYSTEIRAARALLGTLECLPGTRRGRYFAMDLLLVGLRSLAIATLANDGRYCFALPEILTHLVTIGVLRHSDLPALLELRRYKWEYRTGNWSRPPSSEDVLSVVDLVDQRFRLGLACRWASSVALLDRIGDATDESNWYANCRKIESVIMSINLRRVRASPSLTAVHTEVLRRVRSPGEYCATFAGSEWQALKARTLSTGALLA